ncbi:unnamed protein product, partial [Brassica napus]
SRIPIGLPFPGGTPTEELHKHIRIGLMVKECINNYMSKDETQRYLQSRYQFTRQDINEAWGLLERKNPDSLRLHNERIRQRNLRTCERVASSSPREGTSAIQGEQEKQRLSPPPPPSARRPFWNSPNVQRYAAASPQVPQEAANNANALENQNLQASPAYPNDFWQQLLNTLDQIQSKTRHLSALREIKISTDQTVELLTDGHGFGPHPSAARSSQRQRLGEAEERGGDGETEKLQKKEEGNIKEAEKNERGDSMKK